MAIAKGLLAPVRAQLSKGANGSREIDASTRVCVVSWAAAQKGRKPRQESQPWDIRLAVPGEPGSDYPTLGDIPRTSFSCAGKAPGYYADTETNCQAFRVCTTGSTYGFQSFLCPNGTLFNQAVFVCDWWMNVNCDKAQQLFNNNNDKFGNLRLGPQLMKDIKKMITHPMRNPYDKTVMKSNLIVMQDYKPPYNPMFGALTVPGSPNSVFVPPKQAQQNYNGGYNGLAFAASTPNTQYVPPVNNIPSDAEVFQRQRQNQQNGRLVQNNQPISQITNGHAGQFIPTQANANFANSINSFLRSHNQNHNQYNQRQQNFVSTQNSQLLSNQQNTQYRSNAQYNQGNQQPFSRQTGYSYNPNVENVNGQINTEAKQNLVSPKTPTILSKTVTFNRIANPKPGNPKSRITFKTWIVKPSKAAKLIAEPTAYTYARPTNPPKEKLVDNNNSPYTYNVPTITKLVAAEEGSYTYNRPTPPARQVEEGPYTYNRPTLPARQVEEGPYTYNRPTLPARQVEEGPYTYNRPTLPARQVEEGPYTYNRPTLPARQIEEGPYTYDRPTPPARQIIKPSRQYLNPTSPIPTVPSRLYLKPTSPPTMASRLYLAPTTYKPAEKLYIPPPQPSQILSRQYLGPDNNQQANYYQQGPLSGQLRAAPTSPTPVFAAPPTENSGNPSFSLTKHSRINTNRNNLTFTDILTKEKLDITVNDIVSDTSKILKTAAPPQYEQYRQDKSADYSDSTTYIPPDTNDSGEALTSQTPGIRSTPAGFSRLVVDPSRDLEPPVETNINKNQIISNRLANLPYYKEAPTHNIERTVSLKISIPEKVASYLFNNSNETDYDKLEILNTGSSNYLVLTNSLLTKNTGANFIPIGRLISNTNKNSNISDSQALVFSFLADSINAAKEYNNIAKHNIVAPTPQQFQNVNIDELARITNQVSQLTASQYAGNQNNNNNLVNIVSNVDNDANQYQSAKYTNDINQHQQQIPQQSPSRQGSAGHAQQFTNNNQIYSGQLYNLPVPEAANIYNGGAAANLVEANNELRQNLETVHLNAANQNEIGANNNLGKQTSAEIEIVRSQTLPISPAKLQLAPSKEPDDNSAQAFLGNFLNHGNGISAQLQDKIVGTLPHPLGENKLVTYKKDQSYYLFAKLDNELNQGQGQTSNLGQQNAKIIQSNNVPNTVTFQLVPSVSYQLEDEKEQQKILNAFHIDEFGSPKKNNELNNRREDVQIQNTDYAVEHPLAAKLVNGQFNDLNSLYTGPSSYSAPQASVGNLKLGANGSSRLEQLDENTNGYAKEAPVRQFTY